MPKKFHVTVDYNHSFIYEVVAESSKEAEEKVRLAKDTELDTWLVEDQMDFIEIREDQTLEV